MSLRSPLGRVLGLGSAKGGSSHWYAQRVSAVAIALLGIWLLGALLCVGDAGHDAIVGWLHRPVSGALMVLLLVTLAWHAVLGMQVVIEDYVSGKALRLAMIVAVKFVFTVAATLGVLAVLRIGFGVVG